MAAFGVISSSTSLCMSLPSSLSSVLSTRPVKAKLSLIQCQASTSSHNEHNQISIARRNVVGGLMMLGVVGQIALSSNDALAVNNDANLTNFDRVGNEGGIQKNIEATGRKPHNLFGKNPGEEVGNAAKNAVGQAQNLTKDAKDKGKGLLRSLQEGVEGLTSGIAQKDLDVRGSADQVKRNMEDAASNVQKKLR